MPKIEPESDHLTCAEPGCEVIHPNGSRTHPGTLKGWRCEKHKIRDYDVGISP